MSPARSTSSGPGAATTSASRTIATTEQPGDGARPRRAQGAVGEARAGRHGEPGGVQAGDLLGDVGEALGHARRAEDLGDGVGLVGVEVQDLPGPVRVVLVVDGHLDRAVAAHDESQEHPRAGGQLVADADARQEGLDDVHGAMLPPRGRSCAGTTAGWPAARAAAARS